MSIGAEVALLTTCSSCKQPTAAMPGPRQQQDRPVTINGYEKGYVVENRYGDFVICNVCLLIVLNTPPPEPQT